MEKLIIKENPLSIRGKGFLIEQIDNEAPMYDLSFIKNDKLVIDSYGIPIGLTLIKLVQFRNSHKCPITKSTYNKIKELITLPKIKLRYENSESV